MSRGDLGRTWANLGAQKEPKWSPKASQDRAKEEKKSEVKLRKVQGRKKRMVREKGLAPTRPLGEGRGDQDQPQKPQDRPKRAQDRSMTAIRDPKTPQ